MKIGDRVTFFFEYDGKVHPRPATVTVVHAEKEFAGASVPDRHRKAARAGELLTLDVELTDDDRQAGFIAFQDLMFLADPHEPRGGSWARIA